MKLWFQFIVRVTFLLFLASGIAWFLSNIAPTQVVVTKKVPVAMANVDAKAMARELLTPKSYRCLTALIGKESAWDPQAKNPDSSAKGIGQLLNATYDNLGMKHSKDDKAQLIATLAYIGRKYGSGGPCAAWRFHKRHNYF